MRDQRFCLSVSLGQSKLIIPKLSVDMENLGLPVFTCTWFCTVAFTESDTQEWFRGDLST